MRVIVVLPASLNADEASHLAVDDSMTAESSC